MRNAFTGYSYQKQVTLLLLTLMDVERKISKIEIEAKTSDNFDDLIVTADSECFQFQIKDFENVSVQDLRIEGDKIYIKDASLQLSTKHNVLFFNNILIKPNDKCLKFPCFNLCDNISIISLTRGQIDNKISELLKNDPLRRSQLDCFLNQNLDNRNWEISRESLPQLKIFITKLQEKSVLVSHKLLEFDALLLIEGKPGVGKSHFANTLTKKYANNILYRFWIGNQDRDYEERLQFENFIRDLNTKLFYDQKIRTHRDLFEKFKKDEKVLILDGLDHIENYNNKEFESYIKFINDAKDYCKIIVLSRPLVKELTWTKHILENWNLKQTEMVLKKLFHLSDYMVTKEIFRISQGYPIIVKYLAEHFKIHKSIPKVEQVNNIDYYYQKIISDEKGKQCLSLFLCSNSFIMESEIGMFIGDEKLYVSEFIKEHPYLFDIKLNRISLFHDSFNTFLRKYVDYTVKLEKVNAIVSDSILRYEKRFLSRFSFFQLSNEQKKSIVIQYASVDAFKRIVENEVDYESIISFYNQLRETIKDVDLEVISVNNYYDLSLIFNLVSREHLSTINTFYYTYIQSLITNGITDEDITSSDFLFGMYYFVKTKNPVMLYNTTANDQYDIENFHSELERDIEDEEFHIEKHSRPLNKSSIDKALSDKMHLKENLTYIIENIFIHKTEIKGYEILKACIDLFLSGNTEAATYMLRRFLIKFDTHEYYPSWILNDVYNNLKSYGCKIEDGKNEYQECTLNELILKYSDLGSFDLRDKIHRYIRLALLEKREIDIKSIYQYWTKYYQRKDYSLFSLPLALKTLQSENKISLKECVLFICKIQKVSEKGYSQILADFIKLYPPKKIICFLETNFDINTLQVSWFLLPVKYINVMSDSTYNVEESELFRHNRSISIPFEDIENVLYSNKCEKLIFSIEIFKASVSYVQNQKKSISKFLNTKIRFQELKDQNDYKKYHQNSQQGYADGILTYNDKVFIEKVGLKPHEIAKTSNGYYVSLADIRLYNIFTKEQVSLEFKKIMFYSLICKTTSINYFYSVYYHPGNVLAMIKLYRNDNEFKDAIRSFDSFINLSMFCLKLDA